MEYKYKKDTDTTFRAMIDYVEKSKLGVYPLKVKISNHNKHFLQNNSLKYESKNGINVYDIDELIKMKIAAFSDRDKIRDFYDLGFLLS
ncbi:nucleotidyl transferase AbiEii/AbiGii toxin family protein [Campylobacter sp. LR291e]|uniref:nucleotidyl transferase AbiEii/AbiGii toxin family protein n=1 Tax=Campylobacter sp. LR291e TaxID=2593546 RepID=UPI001CC1FBB3|nr:nucleotidyl transferase AbiEii/AbiGii toxin family protein [Campylobacter sp. LR291e]